MFCSFSQAELQLCHVPLLGVRPPVQGYVTGLEPGTSFAYNRSYQRALNRVPTIGPKEQRDFDITYTLLADKSAVDKALQQVKSILHDRPTEVREKPLVDLPKN
jgi:hypothetical protein